MLDLVLTIVFGLITLLGAFILISTLVSTIGPPDEDEEEDDTDLYTPRGVDVSTDTGARIRAEDRQLGGRYIHGEPEIKK